MAKVQSAEKNAFPGQFFTPPTIETTPFLPRIAHPSFVQSINIAKLRAVWMANKTLLYDLLVLCPYRIYRFLMKLSLFNNLFIGHATRLQITHKKIRQKVFRKVVLLECYLVHTILTVCNPYFLINIFFFIYKKKILLKLQLYPKFISFVSLHF